MQFIKALLGIKPADPTRDFGPGTTHELVWDMAKQTLNGVSFGEPVEALSLFGPASHHSYESVIGSRHHSLVYADLGLFIDLDSELRLDYFGVLAGFDEASLTQAESCEIQFGYLRLIPSGQFWNASTPRAELVSFFREKPYRKDTDGSEDIWFFEQAGVEFEFEFEPAGGPLKRINVYPAA